MFAVFAVSVPLFVLEDKNNYDNIIISRLHDNVFQDAVLIINIFAAQTT